MGTGLLGAAFIATWSHRIGMPHGETEAREGRKSHSLIGTLIIQSCPSWVTSTLVVSSTSPRSPEGGFHVPLLYSTTVSLSTRQDMGQGQEAQNGVTGRHRTGSATWAPLCSA